MLQIQFSINFINHSQHHRHVYTDGRFSDLQLKFKTCFRKEDINSGVEWFRLWNWTAVNLVNIFSVFTDYRFYRTNTGSRVTNS